MAKKKEEIVEEKEVEVTTENNFELSPELLEKRVMYNMGFRNIDTNTAFNEYTEDTAELIKTNRGFLSGSVITFIGGSGTGKSTLINETIANAMRPFIVKGDTRVKWHVIDIEGGMNRSRFKNITNLTDKNIHDHVVFETEVSTDRLKSLTAEIIAKKKTEAEDEVEGYTGAKIKVYYPTFILVDAISEMVPDELMDIKKDDNNMYHATQIRHLDQYFKKYLNQLVKYNINLFCIAHQSKKISVDPFKKEIKDWKALPVDMKINGGKILQYATSIGLAISRIIAGDSEAVSKKCGTYLKAKHVMEAKFWKNRQGEEGDSIYLVADADGFNPMKSFIYECHELGIIKPSGISRNIEGWDEKVNAQKLFDLFVENKEFRANLYAQYDKAKAHIFEANQKTKEDREKILSVLDLMNE